MNTTTPPRRDTRGKAAPIVSALIAAGIVDAARATEAEQVVDRTLHAGGAGPRPGARGLLVEVAGYLGGALVVAALGLLLAQRWADLSDGVRLATLAGITVLLLGAGLVVAHVGGGYAELRSGVDAARERLTSALLTAAALAAAVTVGFAVDMAQSPQNYSSWPAFAGGLVMVVCAAAAYGYTPSVIGQAGLLGGSLVAITSGLSLTEDLGNGPLWPGLAFLTLGLVWLGLAALGMLHERLVACTAGSALMLFGAQMPMFDGEHNNLAYALTAGVAVLGFVLYLRTAAVPFLVLGVAAVTLVVPEAIIDWTEGSLGAGGGVLVAGLTLLAASAMGFRMRREVDRDQDEDARRSETEEVSGR